MTGVVRLIVSDCVFITVKGEGRFSKAAAWLSEGGRRSLWARSITLGEWRVLVPGQGVARSSGLLESAQTD